MSPLTTPNIEIPGIAETSSSCLETHPPFSPGWSFDNPYFPTTPAQGSPSTTVGQQQRLAPPVQRLQVPGHSNGPPRRTNGLTQPKSDFQQPPPDIPMKAPGRMLRSVASSPALYTRKDSKDTPTLSPPVHPALRNRNASYDCQKAPSKPPRSFPRTPPPDKPLPAIPTEAISSSQHGPPRLPALPITPPILDGSSPYVTESSLYQDRDGRRDPPPYIELQRKASADQAMPDGDVLSARTRIVMDVLAHMVALLKSRDEGSLAEFSNLVTAQSREMQFRSELASAVRF